MPRTVRAAVAIAWSAVAIAVLGACSSAPAPEPTPPTPTRPAAFEACLVKSGYAIVVRNSPLGRDKVTLPAGFPLTLTPAEDGGARLAVVPGAGAFGRWLQRHERAALDCVPSSGVPQVNRNTVSLCRELIGADTRFLPDKLVVGRIAPGTNVRSVRSNGPIGNEDYPWVRDADKTGPARGVWTSRRAVVSAGCLSGPRGSEPQATPSTIATLAPDRNYDPEPPSALQCSVQPDRVIRLKLELLGTGDPNPSYMSVALRSGFPLWVLHDDDGRPYRAVMVGGGAIADLDSTKDLDCYPAEKFPLGIEQRTITLCAPLLGADPRSFAATSIPAGKLVEFAYPRVSYIGWPERDRKVDVYSSGQRDIYVRVVAKEDAPGSLWAEPKSAYTLVTSPVGIHQATTCPR